MLLCCNCIEHIGMFNILNNEGMGTLSYSKKICWDWFTLKTEKKILAGLFFKILYGMNIRLVNHMTFLA